MFHIPTAWRTSFFSPVSWKHVLAYELKGFLLLGLFFERSPHVAKDSLQLTNTRTSCYSLEMSFSVRDCPIGRKLKRKSSF